MAVFYFSRWLSSNVRHYAKFCANRSNCSGDLAIFLNLEDGGQLLSWISYTPAWTTHEIWW